VIPLFRIDHDETDTRAVEAVLGRCGEWAGGREVDELEESICRYVAAKRCVVMNSGTSALHVALLVHGVGAGDEVIVPSLTFIATANCALMVGATPVFAEVEDVTLGLDPADVEQRISSRTKAIICVHYGGRACRVAAIRDIALRRSIPLIEDAAEAQGAMVQGRMVGTFADSAILSFCQNKVITTGEGGAFVTDSEDSAARARLLRSHGRADDAAYFTSGGSGEYVALGYNFRLSNVLAALGIAQMCRIEDIIGRRRAVAAQYRALLDGLPDVVLPCEDEGERHVYQLYTIRVLAGRTTRDALRTWLADNGVASKVYFDPVHLSAFYRERFGYVPGSLPHTERIAGQVLSLPVFPSMTADEVALVCDRIRAFFGGEPK
jgi:perosamine synthetase